MFHFWRYLKGVQRPNGVISKSDSDVTTGRSWPVSDGLTSTVAIHSSLGLFRHLQGVIDLNPQISNGALQLRMAEQQLNRP